MKQQLFQRDEPARQANRRDDRRQAVRIPFKDWIRLPIDCREAVKGRPYVLSGLSGKEVFVRAILI